GRLRPGHAGPRLSRTAAKALLRRATVPACVTPLSASPITQLAFPIIRYVPAGGTARSECIRCHVREITGSSHTLPYIASSFRHRNDLATRRRGDAAGREPMSAASLSGVRAAPGV